VTDEQEGLQYLKQWNETVKKGAAEVEFDTVFGVGYGKMGVVTAPADSKTSLLFGYYPVRIARHDVGAGQGGYAWQRLARIPLKDDQETHQMLAERFALWSKQGRVNLIKCWNKYLKG